MISYAPLFRTMQEKGISSYRLDQMGFSRATYYSIKSVNSISTNTLNQLSKLLHYAISNVIDFIKK